MEKKRLLGVSLTLLLIFLHTAVYHFIQNNITGAFLPAFWLDLAIPYVSAFVIPYLILTPFIAIAFLMTWKKPDDFLKVNIVFLVLTLISFLFFVYLPTATVRPDVTANNMLDYAVNQIYAGDKALNCFPSLHVSMTFLTLLIIRRYKREYLIPLSVIGLFIILSTLFIKQHNIADIFGGITFAALSFWLVFVRRNTNKQYISVVKR